MSFVHYVSVKNLSPGIMYVVQVRGKNEFGFGPPCEIVTKTAGRKHPMPASIVVQQWPQKATLSVSFKVQQQGGPWVSCAVGVPYWVGEVT